MKTIILIILLLVSLTVIADDSETPIYDSKYGGERIGVVRDDGTIFDKSYRKLGHVDSDGTIYDKSYRKKGRIENDKVYDSPYAGDDVLQYREKDGVIFDDDYHPVGRSDDERGSGYFILNDE